jgi:hypothetical protein
LPDANLRLHRVRLIDDDEASRRLRRIDRLPHRHVRARPFPEHTLGGGKRVLARHVADDREDHVVRHEILSVKRSQIVLGDASQRLGRAAARQPVGMEAVDEPVEQHRCDVVGIFVADPQRRDLPLELTLNLFRSECRIARDIGDEIHAERERVLHDDRVHEGQIGARPGAECAADVIDLLGDLFGVSRRRSLVEQMRDELGNTRLALGILRGAGANEQAHRDRRLLVVQHDDNLHAVRERSHVVRRELHFVRGERARCSFERPVTVLCLSDRARARDGQHDDHTTQQQPAHFVPPLGRIWMTTRLFGVK